MHDQTDLDSHGLHIPYDSFDHGAAESDMGGIIIGCGRS